MRITSVEGVRNSKYCQTHCLEPEHVTFGHKSRERYGNKREQQDRAARLSSVVMVINMHLNLSDIQSTSPEPNCHGIIAAPVGNVAVLAWHKKFEVTLSLFAYTRVAKMRGRFRHAPCQRAYMQTKLCLVRLVIMIFPVLHERQILRPR